ncbi:MAG: TonB-dependent receptor [Leeuwenhoekiella sp.]
MRLKDFSLLLILFFGLQNLAAQFSLSGRVTEAADGQPIAQAQLFLMPSGKSVKTNNDGFYEFANLQGQTYEVTVFTYAYKVLKKAVLVTANSSVDFSLTPLGEQLTEVLLIQKRKELFALKQLNPVEGTAIYAGKKSEVVVLDQLTANLAANNPRQIYSQVVGLNIYENGDAGLQLNIGGRGLNPNRTSNFNTRQNGYDISADVLGYPESYYSPPAEALSEIQVVRGAASLQYGTQFGGLINFKFKEPNPNNNLEITSRQTLGSYGLFTSFNSLSGTQGKLSYYAFFNYKEGDGWRPNSGFSSRNYFGHLDYSFTKNTKISAEVTLLNYLAQQPGGLTDAQFQVDPEFSNRDRNWFKVNWKLYSLRLEHAFSTKTDFSLNLFGLDASRQAVGFRENRVSQIDPGDTPRDLISGNYRNWGAEARLLTRYQLGAQESVFLIGSKYYQARNAERQGPGSTGANADFSFYSEEFPNYNRQSDFEFPNLNVAVFGENIFNLTENFSVTPGFRFEYIKTESQGTFLEVQQDLAGNVVLREEREDNRIFDRAFVLFGLGLSYKPLSSIEVYGNLSQNYRSVTFNDIRVVNPSFRVDPNITDEDGFTADLGLRGRLKNLLSYDVGAYLLSYNNRLGVINRKVSDIQEERFRGNIGDAIIYGVETFADWNFYDTFFQNNNNFSGSLFSNLALTQSEYLRSEEENVTGNDVEFVPGINLKTGLRLGYKNLLGSLQYTYLSQQFSDATNAPRDLSSASGILGSIPGYDVLDLSFSYSYNKLILETGVNNLLDNSYFTRRATGYPGPGILPAEPRTWYITLGIKL